MPYLALPFSLVDSTDLQHSPLPPPAPFPDVAACIPEDTLHWASCLHSFHALHFVNHKSLFHLLPFFPVYTISTCLMYVVPFAVSTMSISVCQGFVCVSSLSSSFQFYFLYLTRHYFPSISAKACLFSFKFANVFHWCGVRFIAAHSSWLR